MPNRPLFPTLIAAALAGVALAALARTPAQAVAPALPLQTLHDIILPGRLTRFDYESFDPRTGLLFIAHLGDSTVLAFDTRNQKLAAEIPDVSEVHGVVAVPALGRVYASATGRDRVAVISETSLRVIAQVPAGNYPDGIAYNPTRHEIYVSDEAGRTDTVIDTDSNRRIATIPLGGEAGNTQFDPVSGRMYVDVQTLDRLVALDPQTRRIVASYPLPGCDHDHGLYIDAGRRLAFIACDGNARLLTFDLRTMRVTAVATVGRDPDVLAFDPTLRRLYVASESGVVTAFQETDAGVIKLGESRLADEAHSVAVDTDHRVYFPLQNLHDHPVLRVMQPSGAAAP